MPFKILVLLSLTTICISDTEAILVTSEPLPAVARSPTVTRDASYSVNVVGVQTNMNTTMQADVINTMTNACRLYDAVSDQETYFRTTLGSIYTDYNWSIFENCGTYALYTNYYCTMSVTITTTTTTVTNQFLTFSSKF